MTHVDREVWFLAKSFREATSDPQTQSLHQSTSEAEIRDTSTAPACPHAFEGAQFYSSKVYPEVFRELGPEGNTILLSSIGLENLDSYLCNLRSSLLGKRKDECSGTAPRMTDLAFYTEQRDAQRWVAVKQLNLSYHNGYI